MERIDVHAHAVPPKYRQYMLDSGFDQPDGIASIPVGKQLYNSSKWSFQISVRLTDE